MPRPCRFVAAFDPVLPWIRRRTAVLIGHVLVGLVLVIAWAGCSAPNQTIETHVATEPEEPLTQVYVTVATSAPLNAFREAVREEVQEMLSARELDVEVRATEWSAQADSSARSARRNDDITRAQREDMSALLRLHEVTHGLRDVDASASGWGHRELETVHVTVIHAEMIDVQAKTSSWQAEIITRSHRLEPEAGRARTTALHLARALEHDGWLRPLLPTASAR